MGKQAIEIVKLDVEQLLKMLNSALSEEWLAYYQYWIGAKLIEGPMRGEVESELIIHATEELGHAEIIANRIIQLGGIPVTNPSEWMNLASCSYEDPKDPYIEVVLNQNINGERCAIETYTKLADFTMGKDHITYQLALGILADEIEHENDLESMLNDILRLKSEIKNMR